MRDPNISITQTNADALNTVLSMARRKHRAAVAAGDEITRFLMAEVIFTASYGIERYQVNDETWDEFEDTLTEAARKANTAATTDTAGEELPERLNQVLTGILAQGGDWTPRRVTAYLRTFGVDVTNERSHQCMKALAERGYLEPVRPRAYTHRLRGTA